MTPSHFQNNNDNNSADNVKHESDDCQAEVTKKIPGATLSNEAAAGLIFHPLVVSDRELETSE